MEARATIVRRGGARRHAPGGRRRAGHRPRELRAHRRASHRRERNGTRGRRRGAAPHRVARRDGRRERANPSSWPESRPGYGEIEILHGVDIVVSRDTVVRFCSGPNGAGKSTTLKVASSRLPPLSGARSGSPVRTSTRSHPERLTCVGRLPHPRGSRRFPNLTVAENLRMFTYAPSAPGGAGTAYAKFPEARATQASGGHDAGGERQMLAMSRPLRRPGRAAARRDLDGPGAPDRRRALRHRGRCSAPIRPYASSSWDTGLGSLSRSAADRRSWL